MKDTIAVAISGGIDSMMTAYLLKAQGNEVIGIHFITGFETGSLKQNRITIKDSHPVYDIGRQIGISVEIIDCRIEFQQGVVDYFTQTYFSGQTPNPCIVCNPLIKFGKLLSFAEEIGANRLATGHYARIIADSENNLHLHKGVDAGKDQSYFLARLSQAQLAKASFPLGNKTKQEIRYLASQNGLKPVVSDESQDICFIKGNSYGNFLAAQAGFKSKPGPIENVDGEIIGEHNGLHLFTIGQRRGINCPAANPYYVVRLDPANNRLIVGSKNDLLTDNCKVDGINWINDPPTAEIKISTRVRYRHKETPSTISPINAETAIVHFDSPEAAVTPGQAAVFYEGDEVLGGGFIAV